MFTENLIYALLAGLAIALVFSTYSDIRHRLIYNKVTIAIALAAPAYWIATGNYSLEAIGLHLLVAVCTFLFFALFFYLGMMGGGDLKLFTALALWFSWDVTLRMIFLASILGGLVTLVFWAIHKVKQQDGPVRVPYGVAITIAGLIIVSERFIYHFG